MYLQVPIHQAHQFPVGTEDIPIRISTLWPYIGTESFHQDNEVSSGCIETDEDSHHNLLGRHPDNASGEKAFDEPYPLGVPFPQGSWPYDEHYHVTVDSVSENRILGL